jgi:hypothetical protein
MMDAKKGPCTVLMTTKRIDGQRYHDKQASKQKPLAKGNFNVGLSRLSISREEEEEEEEREEKGKIKTALGT